MKPYFGRKAAIFLLMLGVLMLPFVGAGIYFYQKHQWAENRLQELEPRHARLLGLEANRDNLAQARERAKVLLAQYVHPSDQDANQTGNAAQQRIRSILTSAGMNVASSQVLEPKDSKDSKNSKEAKDEKIFERIPLSVRAEGEMIALQTALAGLAEQTPAILIDTLLVQGQGAPVRGVQRLAVQFGFVLLRERP